MPSNRALACKKIESSKGRPMIDLKPACDQMIRVVSGIATEQLAAPTPCTEYTVGELIDHVDLVTQGAMALALGISLPSTGYSHLEPDWQDAVIEHLQALGEAWDDPAVWAGSGNVPASDLSNTTWGKITLTELVVHDWDLAKATGQPFDLGGEEGWVLELLFFFFFLLFFLFVLIFYCLFCIFFFFVFFCFFLFFFFFVYFIYWVE